MRLTQIRPPSSQPPEGVKDSAENLGEHLTGELIENSAYEVRALSCGCAGAREGKN
jgi:hypothetical protein